MMSRRALVHSAALLLGASAVSRSQAADIPEAVSASSPSTQPPLKAPAGQDSGPVIRHGSFDMPVVADTYMDMRDWGKGVVWVNGHNLGRYWSVGPQQTVYVPVEWLKPAGNEVVVLELLKPGVKELKGLEKPVLGNQD